MENYRPISILSSIPKILEKVMYDQLYDTFKTHFSLNMSGFLSGHSCCTALLKMVDDWRLALDSKKVTGTIAIDLSKAFDSVCHNLLLAKLRAYSHTLPSDSKELNIIIANSLIGFPFNVVCLKVVFLVPYFLIYIYE